MKYSITGLQEAQQANLRLMAAIEPGLYEGVRVGTLAAHRWSVTQTHVDTGALRASHRVKIQRTWNGPQGTVDIDPSARNPRTGTLASRYGPAEHARGGEHAFYKSTVDRYEHAIARDALAVIVKDYPR